MKTNVLKFYCENKKTPEFNYFDCEEAVRVGVENTQKIIEIFKSQKFLVKEIILCGGEDELSHIGYLAYRAQYVDEKIFFNEACSDYVRGKKEAEEKYKESLSCYYFMVFSVLFKKDNCFIRVLIDAEKNISVIYYEENKKTVNEVANIIPGIENMYPDNCSVEGLEEFEKAFYECNIKITLDRKELFLIAINDVPLLIRGPMVLLYTDREKADNAATNFRKKYNNEDIKVLPIDYKKAFFATMVACGIRNFVLNGDGKVFDFRECCDANSVKRIKNTDKIYDKIKTAQPPRVAPAEETPEGAINSIKMTINQLPEIHRQRLIAAYVCAILAVVFGVIMIIFKESVPMLVFWLFGAVFMSLAGATKVSGKVKEKNPKAATLARFTWVISIISVIMLIIAINI